MPCVANPHDQSGGAYSDTPELRAAFPPAEPSAYTHELREACEFESVLAEKQDEVHAAYPDQLMWGGDKPADYWFRIA